LLDAGAFAADPDELITPVDVGAADAQQFGRPGASADV
jgi:hypothetical protein